MSNTQQKPPNIARELNTVLEDSDYYGVSNTNPSESGGSLTLEKLQALLKEQKEE